jgi:hypothetical protein
MPTYLDAAVVRIQPYLARTPELRLRRGASGLITRASSQASVDAWIQSAGVSGVAPNTEAGHADGVITLTVPDGQGPAVAKRLMLHLRSEIPAADLQASWGEAPTYVEFRRAELQPGNVLLGLPPTADFPLARTCGSCRVDPSAQADGMCADCIARDTSAGRRGTHPSSSRSGAEDAERDALGTERAILDAVNLRTGLDLRPVQDMNDLARLGDTDGNRNHVATVALDGNGMGGFFAALARQGDTGLKQRISPEISAATRSALVNAAASILRDEDRRLPVVPHVLGGDDVVVSVTADRAWPFTSAFLAGFSDELTAAANRLSFPDEVTRQLPTMSAGVIFANASFPYARAVRLAEDALRQAKRDTGGAEAAAAWLDVTVDGEQPPPWRRTLTLAALDGRVADLTALAAIPSSGRQSLARLLAARSDEEARAAGLVWARRNGQTVVTGLLNQSTVTELRNLVALTRWWRP